MWNLIPQLFYDFLARIVPGGILIAAAGMVIYGVEAAAGFVMGLSQMSIAFLILLSVVWAMGGYLIGFVLGQLIQTRAVEELKQLVFPSSNATQKREALDEHNRLRTALGCSALGIAAADLPGSHVMRDHLRLVAPSETARLMKVRAEVRMCEVLFLGFGVLCVLNIIYYFAAVYDASRLELEAFGLVAMLGCWSGAQRLHRNLIRGTTASWLVLLKEIRTKF